EAGLRQAAGEVRGERRLADAALTRHDRDDGVDGGETRPEPPLLGLDLGDDVRAAVPRDVLVLLHAAPSEDHAARASIAAVTAATSAISQAAAEIGRASCRERVEVSGGAGCWESR